MIAFSAVTILFLSSVLQLQQRRRRRFWVRPSLLARRKYSATDFMRDLILDDEDAFDLEYRSGAGFRNFFRISSSTFEEILIMIAPKITRCDIHLRKAVAPRERLAVNRKFNYFELRERDKCSRTRPPLPTKFVHTTNFLLALFVETANLPSDSDVPIGADWHVKAIW